MTKPKVFPIKCRKSPFLTFYYSNVIGKTHLKTTIAVRRLDGHESAFQIPTPWEINHDNPRILKPNNSSVSSSLNTLSSMGTLANPDDFKDR